MKNMNTITLQKYKGEVKYACCLQGYENHNKGINISRRDQIAPLAIKQYKRRTWEGRSLRENEAIPMLNSPRLAGP